ncbi:Rieske (2Fe-2S) protein [Cuniculiplasma sp. SKW4]|uniref:Rieske (2Fe-2S) protein n=1 Tax=Cuniculiplasma sp. SKW4 TaxID=3400171 RepID=UPI003FD40EEF
MKIQVNPDNFDSKGRQRIQMDSLDITILKKNNNYFAFQSECPHKGGPLFLGKLIGENGLMCPSHHIIFDIDSGAVLENPIPESMGEYRKCDSLKIIPVKINDGSIFIDVS